MRIPTDPSRRQAAAWLAAAASLAAAPARAASGDGPPLADRLAAYAHALRFEDLDTATVETAKVHLIDALGCGLAALDAGPVRICRDIALSDGAGAATVLGTDRRSSPELAAFANGVAIRYADFNDVYVGREPGHPSDAIAACLAVAEAERATGRELIASIALAYEINCRLLDAAEVTGRGWDHPVYCLPASALASGRLMRLSPEALTQAVNLAINGHIAMNQTRVQTLSDWKGVADAEATRAGVFAARLARAGLTGPAPIFEGRAGFFKQVSGPFTVDVATFGGEGRPFRISRCGIKPYPAQVYCLTAIPAAIDVVTEAGGVDAVQSLRIDTTHLGYVTAGRDREKWRPTTKDTADHSLPYITARAMLDGAITNDSFAPDRLSDPALLALIDRITVAEDPALTAMQPKAVPNRLTATLRDGREIVRQVDDVPGFVSRPMTRDDVERKFRMNAGKRLDPLEVRRVLDAFWTIDERPDLSGLLALLS
ncbi:MmgE/PrpD family protein [Methylobacterium radiotolerans]|uniref:MmgE/PrpD family protein n=1 Tax=Methylobacterium radiotolerans TaxID=31998 RepID=UPI000D5E363A|nr:MULTISPECIES: MmgE/PrpD family protein [Methylobacterium]MDE3749617.1 MmgE/PrpD family protein [Methylobacterium radiotolerans]PVY88858.1 2-methylcitrate dehydratase [Methylobacterium organophilum]